MLGGELRVGLPSEDAPAGGNVDLVRGSGRDRDATGACGKVVSAQTRANAAGWGRTLRQLHHLLGVALEQPDVAGIHAERRRRLLVERHGLCSEAEVADGVVGDVTAQRGGDGLASEAPGRNARTGLVLTLRGQ